MMQGSPSRPLSLKRFRRDQGGATAIEFAFVAAPFFFMMFALIAAEAFQAQRSGW